MDKAKEYRRIALSCVIYVLIFLTIFLFCQKVPLMGDDAIDKIDISKYHTFSGFLSFINYKYMTWSSRWIINYIMFLVIKLPRIVFSIITALLTVISVYLMAKIASRHFNDPIKCLLLIVLVCGELPFVYFSTAGWMATTTTYYFPLALCIIGISLLILKENIFWQSLAFISLCYSFNNEELMAQAIIIILVVIISKHMHIITNCKKIWVPGLAVLLNLINCLLCPGNSLRVASETKTWFPNFTDLSLFNKIDIGIYTTAQHYLFGFNIPLILFCIVLAIATFKQNASYKVKFVSLLPLITIGFGNACYYLANHVKKGLTFFIFNKEGLFYHFPLYWKAALFQYTLILIFIISITYSLIKLEVDKQWMILEVALMFSALISRTAIGLSPTSYVSATRTFTFLSFTFLVLTLIICIRYLSSYLREIYPILIIGVAFNIISLLLFTFKGVSIFDLWTSIIFNKL